MNNTIKPATRPVNGTTPAASTPSRSVPSPAHLANAGAKGVGRSPWKGSPSTTQTPVAGSLNVHTPTPGGLPGSSPATLDGLTRARGATIGGKSAAGTPAAATPAAFSSLGLTLPSLTGVESQPQLNGNGLLDGLGIAARDSEAYTAQKTKELSELLGSDWGMVNTDNIKACVERIGGLECYWDDHPGAKEKINERRRTLVIAGNEMMLDLHWLGEQVTRVNLNFIRGSDSVPNEAGAEVLLRDLLGHDAAYRSAKPFVENLTRLARIDQLGRGKVSCFEALEGIGESLKKLCDLEVSKENEGTIEKNSAIIKTMCGRSGRPQLDSGDKIGLSLDYWLNYQELAKRVSGLEKIIDLTGSPFSLLIDCEAFNAAQYPPIRTSKSWLSESVADAVSDPTMNIWDDPSLTFIPGTEVENGLGAVAAGLTHITGTQPDVRFLARLQPPVTFPLNAAIEIMTHMEQPLTQDSIALTTYLGLLFPAMANLLDGTKDSRVLISRELAESQHGTDPSSRQQYKICIQPNLWARTITEVPFSHPKQLIEILPYLRQWAFFERLLKNTLSKGVLADGVTLNSRVTAGHKLASNRTKIVKKPINGYRMKYHQYEPLSDTDSDEDGNQDSAFNPRVNWLPPKDEMKKRKQNEDQADMLIEISFDYIPMPRRIDLVISIDYPSAESGICSCSFSLKIHADAKIEVDPGVSLRESKATTTIDDQSQLEILRKRIERTIRIYEDIGSTACWLRDWAQPK